MKEDFEGATPVPENRLEKLYDDVVSIQSQKANFWRRSSKKDSKLLTGSFITNIALVFVILWMLPLIRVVPVFVYTNSFGMWDTATAVSQLPVSHRVAGIEALLWQYLQHREHFSPSEAKQSYDIVSAMSASGSVRDNYQNWANPKLNPNSLAKKLGKGFIRVYRINASFIEHNDNYTSGLYQVRFCRLYVPEGETATAQRMIATYRYELTDTIPLVDRLTFNFAGVIITEYPGPEANGNDIKYVQTPGGENPCERD